MNRMVQKISGLFSFETLFVLYLFAGQYKKDETLLHYFNPPDLTPIMFAATAGVGLFIFCINKFEINKQALGLITIFLSFVCYAGISLSWSSSLDYGKTKIIYLGCQNLWNLVAAAIIIVPNRQRLNRLMFGILIMSLIYVVMSLAVIGRGGTEVAMDTNGVGYDGMSFVISSGIPVLVCYMIDYSRSRSDRTLSFGLCSFYFIILLFVGHRGFLVSSVIGMLFLLILSRYNPVSSQHKVMISKSHIIISIFILITAIGVLQFAGIEAATISRMEGLSSPTQDDSSSTRLVFYKEAFRIWTEHPIFGSGIGSFPVIMGIGDIRGYPHNFILEVLAELGLVGLLIFGFLLFSGVKLLLKNLFANSPQSFFVFLVFMTSFVEALISSDITDHRLMMLALGLTTFPQVKTLTSGIASTYVALSPEVRTAN
jgi:O-antigen ligase